MNIQHNRRETERRPAAGHGQVRVLRDSEGARAVLRQQEALLQQVVLALVQRAPPAGLPARQEAVGELRQRAQRAEGAEGAGPEHAAEQLHQEVQAGQGGSAENVCFCNMR